MFSTMKTARTLIVLFFYFNTAYTAILLWSQRDIHIPALQILKNEDFENLLEELDNPSILTFSTKFLNSATTINKLLSNYTTAYSPSSKITFEDNTDLTGDRKVDFKIIEEALKPYENDSNTLIVLTIQETGNERVKRKIEEVGSSSTSEPPVEMPYAEPSGGPVLYSASSPAKNNVEAMIYSSKSPLLKTNTSTIVLGDATIANMDVRDTYTRLIATIPVESGKITLRFKFQWQYDYWYLNSVEVEFIGARTQQFNLTINQEVTAPPKFSYHCGGHIVFTDVENGVELFLFEVQAQPDANNHRFGDDYNCVPFTTVPIWSGVLVSFILCFGLTFGLYILASIKSMDKFDNQKTKTMTITVWE